MSHWTLHNSKYTGIGYSQIIFFFLHCSLNTNSCLVLNNFSKSCDKEGKKMGFYNNTYWFCICTLSHIRRNLKNRISIGSDLYHIFSSLVSRMVMNILHLLLIHGRKGKNYQFDEFFMADKSCNVLIKGRNRFNKKSGRIDNGGLDLFPK